jgi:hypothetical protein
LLAALLLLIPLALRAHVHAAAHPGSDCAVCVASHQTSAIRATPHGLGAPCTVASPIEAIVVSNHARVERPVHRGRGPPPHLPVTSS